ncbi:MAG: exodeoxyribonuclease V subunit alpha [Burkholderiaceae bacterium]|nr:exodeoxyribonuclease V subunit alpha [Burkholderiaceae bacterium]
MIGAPGLGIDLAIDPASDLAQGFARQVVVWARARGDAASGLDLLERAARAVSEATANGHVCLPLDALVGDAPDALAAARDTLLATGLVLDASASGPSARASVGEPMPLVLDAGFRLYLQRYFRYEQRLARALHRLAGPVTGAADHRRTIDAHFGPGRADDIDWQRLAVAMALRQRLVVVSGGPGTGKTTTVVRLLACLLDEHPDLRIALAAPTGKAAARLLDAIRQRSAGLPRSVAAALPGQASTVHRLLGPLRNAPERFRFHAGNPLALDVLVVDEASMLDLALATRLIEAIPANARLVLLGDRDQLAAVEAGAVFAELSSDPSLSDGARAAIAADAGIPPESISAPAPEARTRLPDTTIWLNRSHRFDRDSGIGRLAARINAGQGREALDAIEPDDDALRWLADDMPALSDRSLAALLDGYRGYIETVRMSSAASDPVQAAETARRAFAALDTFRVLCAQRHGPRGARHLGAMLDAAIQGAIHPAARPASAWWQGKAIVVRRNAPMLGLFNGDTGICLAAPDARLLVWFANGPADWRAVAPARLPPFDSAFATTVHVAQGSEFEHVALLMPARAARVATRELVYTGVTRAMRKVTLISSAEVFDQACRLATRREGGLAQRLLEASTHRPADDPR